MIQILFQNPCIHWTNEVSILDLTRGTRNGLKLLFSQLEESAVHCHWTKGFLSSPSLKDYETILQFLNLVFLLLLGEIFSLFNQIQVERKKFYFFENLILNSHSTFVQLHVYVIQMIHQTSVRSFRAKL